MGVKERGDQFRRLVRSSVDDLFDQRSPFGRLALTHVLMTAGDTLFAVSLAGSLFFSISPTAAKDKVLLYLLLTMGPFAVVAPALGPLIDRSRGARRAMVVTSALGRAVLCPFVARDIHSLLLFPEAFVMLVLSKVYLVTKGALVPEMASLEMSDAGTDPGAPASVSGAVDPTARGPDPTPPYGTPPTVHVDDPVTGQDRVEPDLATLNARLGLLASLSGFVFALPAVAILKLAGSPAVLLSCAVVFVAGVVAGLRLPVRRAARVARAAGRTEPDQRRAAGGRAHRPGGVGAGRRRLVGRRAAGPGRLPPHRRDPGHPGPHADVGAEGPARVPHLPLRLRAPSRGRRHLVVRPAHRCAHRRRGRRCAPGAGGSAGC